MSRPTSTKPLATLAVCVVLAACASSTDIAERSTTSAPTATAPTPRATTAGPETPDPSPDPEEPPDRDGRAPVLVPDEAALEAAQSDPVEDPYYPEYSNPEIDVLHYLLDLDWDGSVLTGGATVTFRLPDSTDEARLDLAAGLSVSDVTLDGQPVEHTRVGDGLEMATTGLEPDTTHTLRISYSGAPEPTPAPSTRMDMTEGLGWSLDREGNVFTFQEPYGAFTWYPVNDHPSDEALYDLRVTTYDGDLAVFNGERTDLATTDDSTTSTWHVDEPMASYVATIAIGPYEEHVDETPTGLRISYWLLPRDRDLLGKLVSDGDAALPWLTEHAGPYPFSTLGVVVVGGTSGMETQTMVTMSRGAVLRPDAVLLHEFAHMWYGNAVTPVDWRGMWLNEGWAMYMQQWFESDTGMVVLGGGVEDWRELDNLSRRVSGPPGDYDPAQFGSSNVYLGPAMMLDEIRQRIGDGDFEALAIDWAAEHDNQNVDRDDFTDFVNAETGRDFTLLIDRWLDSPSTPR